MKIFPRAGFDFDWYIGQIQTDLKVTQREGVHYFPSYEIANIIFPLLGKQPYPDNHHVSGEVVQHIMKAFKTKCLV